MTGEPHEPAIRFTAAGSGDGAAIGAASLWRRLSIEEARRHGAWDAVLRLDPAQRDPTMAATAGREWAVAERLIDHLAKHMGWPASHYRGFTCLGDVSFPPPLSARDDSRAEPVVDARAAATDLAEKLFKCGLALGEWWLLATIAKDEGLPVRFVLTALGHGLRRRGRVLEAARQFDAALAVRLQPLRERPEVLDRQITVVENYHRRKVVFFDGRFYVFHADVSTVIPGPTRGARLRADIQLLRKTLRDMSREPVRSAIRFLLSGAHVFWRHLRHWRRYPVCSAERFLDVMATIDPAMASAHAKP